MKKLLSVMTAIVLLLTAVFVTGAFNVSAELTDNAKLISWKDSEGNPVELAPGAAEIPANITEDNFKLVENTSKLPFKALFSYTLPEAAEQEGEENENTVEPRLNLSEEINASEVKGAIFYIEIPAFGSVTTPDGKTTDEFALGFNFVGHGPVSEADYGDLDENGVSDDQLEDFNWTAYKYGDLDLYVRGVDEKEWSSQTLKEYTIRLNSGWKGYVMIPFDVYNTTDGSFPQHIDENFKITAIRLRDVQSTTEGLVYTNPETEEEITRYGYIPNDKPLVISEPVWMLGGYNETTHCEEFRRGEYKDSLVIGGVEYNYNTGNILDNIKLTEWRDEGGRRVQLLAQSESAVPINITTDNFTLTENTSKLPLTSLFSYKLSEENTTASPTINLSENIKASEIKGAIFYVEIPDFGSVTTPDGKTTDKFALGINFGGYGPVSENNYGDLDGSGTLETIDWAWYAYKYADEDFYIRGVGDYEWTAQELSHYTIRLDSGWKGYVMVPFDTYITTDGSYPQHIDENFQINAVQIRQLQNTAEGLVTADPITGEDVTRYGYIPNDKPLVISEPVWMLGGYNETTNCEEFRTGKGASTFNYGGYVYNYNTGANTASAASRPDASGITAAMHKQYSSASVNLTSGANSSDTVAPGLRKDRGIRSEIASISPLTDLPSCSTTDIIHADNGGMKDSKTQIAAFNFEESKTVPTGGFLVYADIPEVDGSVKFYSALYSGSTLAGYIHYMSNSGLLYVLRDGAAGWESINIGLPANGGQGTYSYAYLSEADATTGKSSFKGWIYLPATLYRTGTNGGTHMQSSTFDSITFSIDPYEYLGSGTKITTPVKFSAVTAITAFDSTKTLVAGDDNKVVDIKTGEEINTDYTSPAQYIGDKSLVTKLRPKDKVIKISHVNMTKQLPFVGEKTSMIGGSWTDATYYVNGSSPVSRMPSVEFNLALETSKSNYIQWDISGNTEYNKMINADDIDGLMFYVKVKNNASLSLNFGSANAVLNSDGTTYSLKYAQTAPNSSAFAILSKNGTAWTTGTANTPSSLCQLPAGFEGYVYVPKFATMETAGTKVWRLMIYAGVSDTAATVNFEIGPIMTVDKGTWTTENGSMACVNGNDIAQDLCSGKFRTVNDLDFDMNVDLVDLIKAQSSYTEESFAEFRKEYMTDYF